MAEGISYPVYSKGTNRCSRCTVQTQFGTRLCNRETQYEIQQDVVRGYRCRIALGGCTISKDSSTGNNASHHVCWLLTCIYLQRKRTPPSQSPDDVDDPHHEHRKRYTRRVSTYVLTPDDCRYINVSPETWKESIDDTSFDSLLLDPEILDQRGSPDDMRAIHEIGTIRGPYQGPYDRNVQCVLCCVCVV